MLSVGIGVVVGEVVVGEEASSGRCSSCPAERLEALRNRRLLGLGTSVSVTGGASRPPRFSLSLVVVAAAAVDVVVAAAAAADVLVALRFSLAEAAAAAAATEVGRRLLICERLDIVVNVAAVAAAALGDEAPFADTATAFFFARMVAALVEWSFCFRSRSQAVFRRAFPF